jgi:hypothetical protein
LTRARDVANVLSTATALATDAETAALIATEVTNRNAAISATGDEDLGLASAQKLRRGSMLQSR